MWVFHGNMWSVFFHEFPQADSHHHQYEGHSGITLLLCLIIRCISWWHHDRHFSYFWPLGTGIHWWRNALYWYFLPCYMSTLLYKRSVCGDLKCHDAHVTLFDSVLFGCNVVLNGLWHPRLANIPGTLYWHGLNLISLCIRDMWDEITYPSPNFNCCTVEVWEWINNLSPHFIHAGIIFNPCQ